MLAMLLADRIQREDMEGIEIYRLMEILWDNASSTQADNDTFDRLRTITNGNRGYADDASVDEKWALWCDLKIYAARSA